MYKIFLVAIALLGASAQSNAQDSTKNAGDIYWSFGAKFTLEHFTFYDAPFVGKWFLQPSLGDKFKNIGYSIFAECTFWKTKHLRLAMSPLFAAEHNLYYARSFRLGVDVICEWDIWKGILAGVRAGYHRGIAFKDNFYSTFENGQWVQHSDWGKPVRSAGAILGIDLGYRFAKIPIDIFFTHQLLVYRPVYHNVLPIDFLTQTQFGLRYRFDKTR